MEASTTHRGRHRPHDSGVVPDVSRPGDDVTAVLARIGHVVQGLMVLMGLAVAFAGPVGAGLDLAALGVGLAVAMHLCLHYG